MQIKYRHHRAGLSTDNNKYPRQYGQRELCAYVGKAYIRILGNN
jgi:hypothetical protein